VELKEAVTKRRSVRKYYDKPISDDILHDIMENAVWAPSGVNLQPWYFVVIRSPEERRKLTDLLVLAKEKTSPYIHARFKDHPEIVKDTLTFMESMGNAPVCVLAFLYTKYENDQHSACVQSLAAAVQNIMLLAYEKGIGTCWTIGSLNVAKEIEARYGEGRGEYMGMMAMGYCDFPKYAPPRKNGRVKYI
jgi:nitroreductase